MYLVLKNPSSVKSIEVCYPDDGVAVLVERNVSTPLPVIAGLTDDLPVVERVQIFTAAVAKSWLEFCTVNGDPFGCDNASAVPEVAVGHLELSLVF